MRQESKDPLAVSGLAGSQRPPPHLAKDVLGAAVTLAVLGAFLLRATNSLAGPCSAKLSQRTGSTACSGISAVASHAHEIITLSVLACAALAAIAFIWYMFWGYRTRGQARGNRDD